MCKKFEYDLYFLIQRMSFSKIIRFGAKLAGGKLYHQTLIAIFWYFKDCKLALRMFDCEKVRFFSYFSTHYILI